MKRRCKAKTKDGKPCSAYAGPSGYCAFHDPAHGAARAVGRKQGGERHRTPHGGIDPAALPVKVRTLDDVLVVLDYALAEAMPLENSVQRGRLIVGIAHAFIEAIKTGELETRLAAIEAALKIGEQKQ
jgi:hypothetical protein